MPVSNVLQEPSTTQLRWHVIQSVEPIPNLKLEDVSVTLVILLSTIDVKPAQKEPDTMLLLKSA